MNIEVKGIGFPNKGAELMLSAIRDWQSQTDPAGRLILSSQSGFGSRRRFGAWQYFSREERSAALEKLSNVVPRRFLTEFGIMRASDIDTVLDASGFAYGDQWGAPKAHHRLAKRIAAWRSRGTKLVLLPQAFGPFRDPALREHMKRIVDYATLVYARDQKSLDYLREIAPAATSIMLAPDFTCLVGGRVPEKYSQWKDRACIIPNQKMIDHGAQAEGQYVQFLRHACTVLHESGHQPFLLLHEGPSDRRLCELVRDSLSFAPPIVEADEPEVIKGVIGASRVVVTSRFHGFVSALSKGVPAVATSWSHKYEMLAVDYGNPQLVLKDLSPEGFRRALSFLENKSAHADLRLSLEQAAAENRRKSRAMWQNITTALALG